MQSQRFILRAPWSQSGDRPMWAFECPEDDCDFSTSRNEEAEAIEDAQQHMDDKHGNMPTREEIEPYVIGPG